MPADSHGAVRRIIHIDMDAFYAAVEQRDDPRLRGRSVIVGGSPASRGVVATCSYEARPYGIRSAMPAWRAARLCPDAVFLRPRFEVYRAESRRIFDILRRYTGLVEPLSLDEAYLDVTDACDNATALARVIRARIRAETGLTASAGVSYNKFLAKTASDLDKPDGLYVIPPQRGPAFMAELPVGAFHGVGRATEARMRALGIRTGADLGQWSLEGLREHFGARAEHYFNLARGVDRRPVTPHRERKSVGAETTFDRDLTDVREMREHLQRLAEQVAAALERRRLSARTLTVKVRYADFRQMTRSRTLDEPFSGRAAMGPLLAELLAATEAGALPVRLLGVTAANLSAAERDRDPRPQLTLF